MKKILILYFVALWSYSVKAQNVISDCGFYEKETAMNDVKERKIQILLKGGIAPKMDSNQDVFSKKYAFEYIELGCMGISEACLRQYNQVMADYLDKKYGKKWRKGIRKDVLF